MTKVLGSHTFKFGGEYRKLGINRVDRFNGSGTFSFSRLTTGLVGLPSSGNAIASFILGAVDSAQGQFNTVEAWYARADAWNMHFGDTWKATSKLSVNVGLRWDVSRPSVEKYNRTSFFDFGPNPGAGGRPGRLAFAGDKWGREASARGIRRRPGFAVRAAPRAGVQSDAAVGRPHRLRDHFHPGLLPRVERRHRARRLQLEREFSSSQSGLQPAFPLADGLPQNFQRPPFIDPSYRNGQGLRYRPFDANRLPYSQQWNFTIEHQFSSNFYVSARTLETRARE